MKLHSRLSPRPQPSLRASAILATKMITLVNAAEWVVYDALYAYCRQMVRQGKANGKFAT